MSAGEADDGRARSPDDDPHPQALRLDAGPGRRRSGTSAGGGPRPGRRERGRQIDPDEGAERRDPARLRRADVGQPALSAARPARRPPPRRRHDLPGTDPGPAPQRRGQRRPRSGVLALRLPPARRRPPPRRGGAGRLGAPRDPAGRLRGRADARGPAAGRDRPGAAARRARAGAGRADQLADAAGRQAIVRPGPPAARPRRDGGVHLPLPRRGAADRRPLHGAARRPQRRRRPHRRLRRRPHRRDDGRPQPRRAVSAHAAHGRPADSGVDGPHRRSIAARRRSDAAPRRDPRHRRGRGRGPHRVAAGRLRPRPGAPGTGRRPRAVR